MKLYLIFAVFLLSNHHYYQAEGIRLRRVILSASSHQEIMKISSIKGSNQDNDQLLAKTDEHSSGSTLEKRRLISSRVLVVTKKSHDHDHWLPKIHEDYFGPRHHLPRHH